MGRLAALRFHVAAMCALLLVLATAAIGASNAPILAARSTSTAGGNGASARATSTGIPGANLSPGASAGTGGGGSNAAGGTGGGQALAGRHITYDDGANDNEVLVGGSTFTSGPAAVYGEQIAVGFAAGVNYVNDHGGINGRQLKFKLYDDGGDPAKQLANTKRLVEVDHAFALTMSYAPVAGDYVASQGVPVYHLGQFNEEFTNPWWFPLGGPQLTSAMALAAAGSRTLGAKSVSIFYIDAGANNFSRAFAEKVASYWKAYGVDVKALVPFTPDQTSCSDGISEASKDKVDFVDFEIDAGHVIQCGVEAQIQGYKPPKGWGGYLIGVPVIHEALGDFSQGMYAFDAFGADYDNADYVKYVHAVSAKTDTYSSVTISYFIAALLVQDSMSKLGDDFTRTHLRDILNSYTDWTPGLTTSDNQPRWTWRPDCHYGIRGGYLIQIQKQPDGSLKWVQITPQGKGVPLPPGIGPPEDLASCPVFLSPQDAGF